MQDDQKQYYEAQLQKKVLFVPNLSNFLDKLNQQILKLPNEMRDPNTNMEPQGTKYDDIVRSFCNGVDVAMANLRPVLRQQYQTSLRSWQEGTTDIDPKLKTMRYKEPESLKDKSDFLKALDKLGWIYDVLEDADMLNDHVISANLPEDGEDYDDALVEEGDADDADERKVPAPEHKTDGKPVGPVEKEVPRPVAEAHLAPSVPG